MEHEERRDRVSNRVIVSRVHDSSIYYQCLRGYKPVLFTVSGVDRHIGVFNFFTVEVVGL